MRTSPFLLASDNVFKQIKETGAISDDVFALLKTPRTAFESESRIIAGEDTLSVMNSSLFELLYWMRVKIPGLFYFLNRIGNICKKTGKYFLVKISRKKDGGIKHYN